MALAKKEVNPLGVLKLRKLNKIPTHFSKMAITYDVSFNLLKCELWITTHLNSRYAIVRTAGLSSDNQFQEVLEFGFESPSELSFFALACPHLYKK